MSTLKRFAVGLAIGGAIGLALAGVGFIPHLSAVSVVSIWVIGVAVGVMLVVNWTSRALYRLRGGWKVQLTYGLRSPVWDPLDDTEVVSEWNRLGSPVPACELESGWRHRRTNSVLLWFTDAHGEKCEVFAPAPGDPILRWSVGLLVLVGQREFKCFPRSLPLVLCARFHHRHDPLTSDALRQTWVGMGCDERRLPAHGSRDVDDDHVHFEGHNPHGSPVVISRGMRTEFKKWRAFGPMCLIYGDLPSAAAESQGEAPA